MHIDKEHYTEVVNDYDVLADKVVMRNEELHQAILNEIKFEVGAGLNVLDLGCGTGHGMGLILDRFPNAYVTGVDFSQEMILAARQKLSSFKERFDLIETDLVNFETDKTFDVIISAVTIHNLPHEEKALIFRKIYSLLNKDGIFVNGDFIEGENKETNDLIKKEYREYLEANLSGEMLKKWLKHAFEEDAPMKFSEQTELLKRIGFKKVNQAWQYSNELVYVAEK